VKLKHNANSALIDGKSIVLVDDSIVRGTTSVKLVQMMRDAGAREVHMRIASPRRGTVASMVSTRPSAAKLLAAQMNIEQMRDYINADSLAFISIEGLYRALGDERDAAAPQRCDACFTGDYPTSLTDASEKDGGASLVAGGEPLASTHEAAVRAQDTIVSCQCMR
jgi:amidophosphoribosyltransferase